MYRVKFVSSRYGIYDFVVGNCPSIKINLDNSGFNNERYKFVC